MATQLRWEVKTVISTSGDETVLVIKWFRDGETYSSKTANVVLSEEQLQLPKVNLEAHILAEVQAKVQQFEAEERRAVKIEWLRSLSYNPPKEG